MNAIRTTPPTQGEDPAWAEHWALVTNEWEIAAREVCQLADRTQAETSRYLVWTRGQIEPGMEPWWFSRLDWERFADDLAKGRTALSSSEQALARVAIGLVQRQGLFESEVLLSAGYFTDVIAILQQCAEAIESGSGS